MTLLRTKEYIDIVELNELVTKLYGLPEIGSSNSFHRQVSNELYGAGQDAMCTLMLSDIRIDNPESEVVRAFDLLIADGHLPDRDEFEIYVWW